MAELSKLPSVLLVRVQTLWRAVVEIFAFSTVLV